MEDLKICIGFPLSVNMVPVEFLESMLAMKKPMKHMFVRASAYLGVDHMRNQLVEAAISYDCTHLLFLDTDHRHHPETIIKLLSLDLPIVSGLSFKRLPPFEPTMYMGEINSFETIMEWEPEALIEVDFVGAAAMLVKIDVLKEMKYPYFKFTKNPDPEIKFDIGEDAYFCKQVKELGYKIYVDTALPNKHIGNVEVDQDFYEIFRNNTAMVDYKVLG